MSDLIKALAIGATFLVCAFAIMSLPQIVLLVALNVFAVTAFGALLLTGWRLGNGR